MTYLERSVESAEKNAEFLLKYQITDPQSPDFGGYYNKGGINFFFNDVTNFERRFSIRVR